MLFPWSFLYCNLFDETHLCYGEEISPGVEIEKKDSGKLVLNSVIILHYRCLSEIKRTVKRRKNKIN